MSIDLNQRQIFEKYIAESMDELPEEYIKNLNNVVIVLEERPSLDQARRLGLRCNTLLFGLYEGVPLSIRGTGNTLAPPDKISLFIEPILAVSNDDQALKRQIKRTLWHEIAHHYGLDHARIHQLESKVLTDNH